MELEPGIEPGPALYEGAALPSELFQRKTADETGGSNLRLPPP